MISENTVSRQAERIIEFANAPLHDRNWRERVTAMSVEPVIEMATPTAGDVVGIASLDDARGIQRELQELLNRIIEAGEDGGFAKRAEVSERIQTRVRIQVVYRPHATEGRLESFWETEKSSVLEYLYVQLAQALATEGFAAFAHCPTCGKFIYRRTQHGQRYCSDSCRALASFRRRRDAPDAPPEAPSMKRRRTARSRRSS